MTPPAFLVVLDADSTLLHDEVIELLADEAGSASTVREITERAMRGELDFAESLRARVATLAGLDEGCFERIRRRVTVTAGAGELVRVVRAGGGAVGVVSGGFHEVLDPIARSVGVDRWRANRLELTAGRLTGAVAGPIVDAGSKAEALVEWAREFRIPLSRSVAVGDGANDLLMMDEAVLSVAFNAKEIVKAAAHVAIDSQDLSQLLPLLGLRG